MKIAGKELRPGREAFIVAEIGINHGGSARRAIEIIDQLHASGASFDAVKLQFYTTERLCSSAVDPETRKVLDECELWPADMLSILEHAKSKGYAAICTVFNGEDFLTLLPYGVVDAWKIASPDAVHHEFIEFVAKKTDYVFTPIIVSTGTCDATETDALAALLKNVAPERHAMLECVSAYPTQVRSDDAIVWMALSYPNAVIGFSDHTTDPLAGCRAARVGARIIEKHVMASDEEGIDASVSVPPSEFAEYCRAIRTRGSIDAQKVVRPGEDFARASARQSIVLREPVESGGLIAPRNMTYKRPGTGIPAKEWPRVIGTTAARPIKADVPLQWEDLEPASSTPPDSASTSEATPTR